jgi:hypothetical protein
MPEAESPRSPSTPWAALLAVAAALLGGFAVGTRRPSEDTPRPEAANKKEDPTATRHAAAPDDSLRPVRSFIATHGPAPTPALKDDKQYDELTNDYDVRYLIVTVPDPVDSRFGYAFDQLMAVTERALETNGYVFDRAWLPWELDKKKLKEKEGTVVRVGLFGVPLGATDDEAAGQGAYREKFPGAILFRDNGPRRGKTGERVRGKLCVVYLVGENPTSGIDKRAFSASLDLIAKYKPACGDKPWRTHLIAQAVAAQGLALPSAIAPGFPQVVAALKVASLDPPDDNHILIAQAVAALGLAPPGATAPGFLQVVVALRVASLYACDDKHIRVVGPYFTGSQTSLKHALDTWRSGPNRQDYFFEVISGAANAVGKKELFPDGKDEHTSFYATVIPSEKILRATLHYLDQRDGSRSDDKLECGKCPEGVAILVEANTIFGQEMLAAFQPSGGRGDKKKEEVNKKFRSLPFPMHISGVEASYEKQRRLQDEQLGLPQLDSLIPRLGTSPAPNADLIPAQDAATTTTVNGKVLTNILAVITREQMRYVGIVASDPRDTIFLASSIREHCPGVQIFVIGSDLLFSLPEYSYYLRGTIVGSTYPLLADNQRWTKPDEASRLLFSDQQAQGCYNAILAQFGNHKDMLEYRAPEFKDTDKGEADRPPIWITMIGQNGDVVPLQFFTNYKTKEDVDYVWPPPTLMTAPGKIKKMDQPFPGAASLALAAVCAFALVVFFYAFRRDSPQFFWPLPESNEQRGTTSLLSGMALRVVCFLALSILLYPIAHLCVIQLKSVGECAGWAWWLFVSAVLAFFNFGLVGPALLLSTPAGRRSLLPHRLWAVIVCDVVLCTALFLSGWSAQQVILLPPLYLLGLVGPALFGPLVPRTRAVWAVGTGISVGVVSLVLLRWHLSEPLNSWEGFFVYRSLHFSSGVSLLLPLSLLCAEFFCWALFQMKGRQDSNCFLVPTPYPKPKLKKARFLIFQKVREAGRNLTDEVRDLITFARKNLMWLVVLLLLTVVGSWQLWFLFPPTVEGRWWTDLFYFGFIIGGFLVVFNLLRLLILWSRLKDLCHEIAGIPMMGAFSRLPAKLTSVFGGYLGPPRPRLSHLRVPIHQLRLLQQETERLLSEDRQPKTILPPDSAARLREDTVWLDSTSALGDVTANLQGFEKYVASQFPELALSEGGGRDGSRTGKTDEDHSCVLRGWLSSRSRMLLTLLPRFWPRRPVDEAFGSADSAASPKQPETAPGAPETETDSRGESPGGGPAAGSDRFARWVELAEGFVATQVVIYISQFFVQLRTLVWSMVVCSTLLLLAVTSYPFQPQRFIVFTMLALIGAVVAGILYVLYMVNRDELVSHITGKAPNRFTPDIGFFFSVFTYIVPVVSVVALQLTGAFRFMLEPILRILK